MSALGAWILLGLVVLAVGLWLYIAFSPALWAYFPVAIGAAWAMSRLRR